MNTYLVLPTYNERDNLKPLLGLVFATLPDIHVLVVDDNSPDGTGELAEQMKASYPGRLECLHRDKKEGLGAAYIQGFQYVIDRGADKIIQMDSDFSHPVEKLPEMLSLAGRYDLVIGSRYVPGGGTSGWPLRRRVLSWWASFYSRAILKIPVHDVTSGFICFDRKVLEAIAPASATCAGYGFLIDLKYRSYLKGFSITEMPIVFKERVQGQSKMGLGIAFEAAVMVWKMKLAYRSRKDFSIT